MKDGLIEYLWSKILRYFTRSLFLAVTKKWDLLVDDCNEIKLWDSNPKHPILPIIIEPAPFCHSDAITSYSSIQMKQSQIHSQAEIYETLIYGRARAKIYRF